MNRIIPEKRNLNDNNSYWKKHNKDGIIECYSKEYFNSDLSRKEIIEEERKNCIVGIY